VAHSETRGAGLNESVLLGPGQNGETQRGKTLSGTGYSSASQFCGQYSLDMQTRKF
jgi:hypothetical protein